MKQYRVRSGQNIYDVALTLYGSVEGLFDLLASNRDLTMETPLQYGMMLNYHDEFVVNKEIVRWLKDKKMTVKNGEYVCRYIDMEKYIFTRFVQNHPNLNLYLDQMSTDEKTMFWQSLYMPRMIVKHDGQLTSFKFKLLKNKHLFIDFGDTTELQTFEGTAEHEVEHYYKGDGKHVITFYGDFEFEILDLSGLNGIYFPLSIIHTNVFISPLNNDKLNKLIVTT